MIKKIVAVSLLLGTLTACQSTRFVFSPNVPETPSYYQTMHYTFWGKKAMIDPVKVCGSAENVAMVEEKEKTGQSWLRWLTANIYQPVTVSVYCKRPVNTSYWADQPIENIR